MEGRSLLKKILQKKQIKHVSRYLCLLLLLANLGLLHGCYFTKSTINSLSAKSDFQGKPVLVDEIRAIGKPDDTMLKRLDVSDALALIGKENTYILSLGGKELEQISKLKLDSNKLTVVTNKILYLRGQEFWGAVRLEYETIEPVSPEEKVELELGGFSAIRHTKFGVAIKVKYANTIKVEGALYPAVKMNDEQFANLKLKRKISFYHSPEEKPSMFTKAGMALEKHGPYFFLVTMTFGVFLDTLSPPLSLGLNVYELHEDKKAESEKKLY